MFAISKKTKQNNVLTYTKSKLNGPEILHKQIYVQRQVQQ